MKNTGGMYIDIHTSAYKINFQEYTITFLKKSGKTRFYWE